jgi:hypothetical protein
MDRLNIEDPNCWNKWRELYNELNFQEQLKFANDAECRYPHQEHHTKPVIESVLKNFIQPINVLEIGGWKGELAANCFRKFRINSWNNIELSTNATQKTVRELLGFEYHTINPERFDWWADPLTETKKSAYQICISAHTIEHFSNEHLLGIIDYISGIPVVVFEAPIKEDGDDWKDYGGTHMLTMGWRGVNKAMQDKKYSAEKLTEHCYVYRL